MTKIIKMKNESLKDILVSFGSDLDIEIVKRKDGIAIKNTFATEIQVVEEHIRELSNSQRDDSMLGGYYNNPMYR